MAIDHPIFILKKYTATVSKVNTRNQASITADNCSPVFSYPIVDEVEYVPVAFVCNERSNANCSLNGINLDPEGTKLFAVGNLSDSNITSSTTHSITVMFAPSYMVDGDLTNPIFTKRTFYLETGDSLAAGESHSYTANDLEYSIPQGYVPFSLTKFFVPGTNCIIFTTVNPLATGNDIFVTTNNMYTAARSTDEMTIEVVFVREDMQDLALRQALYLTAQSGVSVTCNRGSLVLPNEIVNLSVDNPDRSNYDYHIAIDGITEETTYIDDVAYSFPMPDNNVSINVSKASYEPFFDVTDNHKDLYPPFNANTEYAITKEDIRYSIPYRGIAVTRGFDITRDNTTYAQAPMIFTKYSPYDAADVANMAVIRNHTSTGFSAVDELNIDFYTTFIDGSLIDDRRG